MTFFVALAIATSMASIDFTDISYLEDVNPRAFQAISSLRILNILHNFDPILVGTFPLKLEKPTSDLDVICSAEDLNAFAHFVQESFSNAKDFTSEFGEITKRKQIERKGEEEPGGPLESIERAPYFCANFTSNGFPFEIFCQSLPTRRQNGFRHLVIEQRLLDIGGHPFFDKVKALLHSGVKTEPGFVRLLGLDNRRSGSDESHNNAKSQSDDTVDPYEKLLELEEWSDEDLHTLITNAMQK